MIFYRLRKTWYSLSAVLLIIGIVTVAIWGLPLGIDFTGGNIAEVAPASGSTIESIRESLRAGEIDAVVQSTSQETFIVKFAHDAEIPQQEALTQALGENATILQFDSVGPTVGKSLQQRALSALVVASIAIIIYLAWAFRTVNTITSAWSFGVIAVIALIHDAMIVTGLFAIIGHFNATVSIDAYFITALLTIIGYSVNDTIVVFDRLREVLRTQPTLPIGDAVEVSVGQTMGRSLNTSLTVLLVLLPMLILGRGSLQSFLLALTIGVVVGTYSSIFIAAPLVATWHQYKHRLGKASRAR